MKKLIILILLALSSITYGQLSQINVGTSANDGTGESLRSAFQKVNLGITQINTNTGNIALKLAITDTTNMLLRYINKADTAAMLSKYLRIADTVGIGGGAAFDTNYLYSVIGGKLAISDTSGMLADYINKADTATMLSPYITDIEARNAINDSITARLNGATDISAILSDYELSLGNPASDGYVLSSTSAGVRSWVQAGAGASYDSTYIHYRVDSLTTVVSNLQSELTSLIDAINRLDLGDITPPRFLSAEIGTYSDSIVVMLMDTTDILQDSVPLASHFALTEGGIGVGIDTVTINIDTVFIALDSTLTAGTTLLLDYTSGFPALQDSSGNKTVSWENKVVTNNITASTLLNGLVGYWKLDESTGDAIDETANGNDGVVGDVTRGETGKISNAYLFKGPSGRTTPDAVNGIIMPTSSVFNLASAGSLSLWFTNLLGAYQEGYIAGTLESDTKPGFGILLGNKGAGGFQQIVTSIGNDTDTISNTWSTTLNHDGTVWYHVVMTWDVDGNFITYVNGIAVDSRDVNISLTNAPQFTVGINNNDYNPRWHSGKIDEIILYNRALTSDEVTDLNELTQPQ